MGTLDEGKERSVDAAQSRGEQLDEVVEKVGAAVEEKVEPVAERVAEKVVEKTGGLPDDSKK